MAMVKLIAPAGWDWERPTAARIKIASDGLRGIDRRDFIKLASGSENIFLPYLDSVKFAAGEEPVHTIAIGAHEKWGFNRNGDGFSKKACHDYHKTFEKFAKVYRNHNNKNPANSYGHIKLSAYNPRMDRIELLLALNGTKEAAERNGGHLADKELARLEKEGQLPGSMACRVGHDVCSFCGNNARTRDDYCTSEKCAAGGCKDNLTKLVKVGNDLHHLGVMNPHPTFFDWSHVFRPAERTAYGAMADYITKAAADGLFEVGSAKIAQDLGITAPLPVILHQDASWPGEWDERLTAQIKLAHALAALESDSSAIGLHSDVKRAFDHALQPDLPLEKLGLDAFSSVQTAMPAGIGALADCKIVLPLREFAKMTKRSSLCEDASKVVPGALQRMITDGSLERRLRTNPYAPAEKLASYAVRQAAVGLKSTHSLEKEAVEYRCQLSVVRGYAAPSSISVYWTEKKASDSPLIEELARDYALYKVAALAHIARSDANFPLTARLSLVQNQCT